MSFLSVTKRKIIFFVITVSLLTARGFFILSDKANQTSHLKTKNDKSKDETELISPPEPEESRFESNFAELQNSIEENVPRKVKDENKTGAKNEAKTFYSSDAGTRKNHLSKKNTAKNIFNNVNSVAKNNPFAVDEPKHLGGEEGPHIGEHKLAGESVLVEENYSVEPTVEVELEKDQRISKDRSFRYSKLNIEAGAGYSLLEGTDPGDGTSGRLLSELSPQFLIAWRQIWSEKISSKFFMGLSSINFQPEESGLNLKNSSKMKSRFGIGFGTEMSDVIHGFLDVEIEQTLFYQGVAGGGIEINQVPLLKFTPGFRWVLLNKEPFAVELLGSVSYWSASSYDAYSIDQGTGYKTGFRLSQKTEKSEFYCSLNYRERMQRTSILNLNEKETGMFCGLEWSFGL